MSQTVTEIKRKRGRPRKVPKNRYVMPKTPRGTMRGRKRVAAGLLPDTYQRLVEFCNRFHIGTSDAAEFLLSRALADDSALAKDIVLRDSVDLESAGALVEPAILGVLIANKKLPTTQTTDGTYLRRADVEKIAKKLNRILQ